MALVIIPGLERRIGKPERTVALDHDVVGGIETLAVIVVGENSDAAVVFGAGDAAALIVGGRAFAGNQSALAITGQAIGMVRGVPENAE